MAAVASLVPSTRSSTDLYLIRSSDGNRPKRGRVKSVSWAAEDAICQVRQFLSEDCPYMLGPVQRGICRLHDSGFIKYTGGVECPPGFGRSALKRARIESEMNMSVQIQWFHPLKFVIDTELSVAVGDESTEVKLHQNRELTVFEAFYPRLSSIPESPLEMQDCSNVDGSNDSQVPLIPLYDEDISVINDAPEDCGSAGGQSNTGVHPSSSGGYYDLKCKSARDADENIAAAAACMVVEKLGVKDQVDQQLLLDILRNPALINALTSANQVSKESISFTCGNVLDKSCHGIVGSHRLNQLAGDQHSTISSSFYLDRSQPYVSSSSASSVTYSDGYAAVPHAMLNSAPGPVMGEVQAYDPKIASGRGDPHYFRANPANVSQVMSNGYRSSHFYKPLMNDNTTESLARASQEEAVNRYAYGGHAARGVGKTRRLCMFFNTAKGCRNGENCPFVHQTSTRS